MDLSVTADGAFTVASWLTTTYGKSITLWGADLRKQQRIEHDDYLVGWAHSISFDGKLIAYVTTGGAQQSIEVADTRTGDVQKRWAAPNQPLPMGIVLFGQAERGLIYSDGEHSFVYDIEGNQTQAIRSYEGYPKISANRQFAEISRLYWEGYDSFGEPILERQRRFYAAVDMRLSLLFSESRLADDWDGQGAAIGSNGMVAIQTPELIRFWTSEDKGRELAWPMSSGRLLKFDPTNNYLLFDRDSELIVADCQNGQVLGSYQSSSDWMGKICGFLDSEHVLICETPVGAERNSRSDRLVRWNWRHGTSVSRSIGGVDATTLNRWLLCLGAAVAAWTVTAVWLARTSQRHGPPIVVLLALATLTLSWAYCHPRFEEHYIDWEIESPNWLMLATVWIGAGLVTCVGSLIGRGQARRQAPFLLSVLAICADRTYWLTASGSWFFPLIILFNSVLLVLVLGRMRRTGTHYRLIGMAKDFSKSKNDMTIRLIDLVLVIGAVAVLLALVSRFKPIDQDVESVIWAMGCSVAISSSVLLAAWSGLARIRWYWRYPPLAIYTLLLCWAFSRVDWIEGGDRFPMLYGDVFAVLLGLISGLTAFTAWLHRGCIWSDRQENLCSKSAAIAQ